MKNETFDYKEFMEEKEAAEEEITAAEEPSAMVKAAVDWTKARVWPERWTKAVLIRPPNTF